MILIGIALYFVVLTTRPNPLPEAWRSATETALRATAENARLKWESGGKRELTAYLNEEGQNARSRLWLFDADGRELSGLPLPTGDEPEGPPRGQDAPGQPQGERRGPPDGGGLPDDRRPFDGRGPRDDFGPRGGRPFDGRGGPGEGRPFPPDELPNAAKILRLSRLAARDERAVYEMAGPRVMAAIASRAEGKSYVLVSTMPAPRFGRPAAEPRTQILGGLVVLLLSGCVCYGLVRYLTYPLLSLRDATQKLAGGDLTARTGAASQPRRDEVADLGRDFDTMAERIESLINAQNQLLGDISHELRSPLSRLSMALALARRHAAAGHSAHATSVLPPSPNATSVLPHATQKLPSQTLPSQPQTALGQNAAAPSAAAPNSAADLNTALDRIGREAKRLNTLIAQLLTLARLENGEAGAGFDGAGETLDLEQLIRDVVADADFEARNVQRAVRMVLCQPCRSHGVRDLIHSAVENVVRNAIRHTAPDTTVEVKLERENGFALITVRDYGPGVPANALDQIFRPFYRVEASRDRDTGGVGLGLAITERAIRSHRGTIRACNAGGGGLEIQIKIPVSRL